MLWLWEAVWRLAAARVAARQLLAIARGEPDASGPLTLRQQLR